MLVYYVLLNVGEEFNLVLVYYVLHVLNVGEEFHFVLYQPLD